MGDELARCVGVQPGEGDHGPPTDATGEVLERGRVRAPAPKLGAHQPLVRACLVAVRMEGHREPATTGQPRSDLHLLQCLHLDRMHVGEVLGQLLLDRAVAHRRSPCWLPRGTTRDAHATEGQACDRGSEAMGG